MDKSKSGRVRKKPKKFDDFESQDDVPVNQSQRQQIRKGKKKVSYLNLESCFKTLLGFFQKHFWIGRCMRKIDFLKARRNDVNVFLMSFRCPFNVILIEF